MNKKQFKRKRVIKMFFPFQHQDDIKVDMDIQSMEADLSSFFGTVDSEPRMSPTAPGKSY